MKVILVTGVSDSGKTTLVDEIMASHSALRRPDVVAMKREIMKMSSDRLLHSFADGSWHLLDQEVTTKLNIAFYEALASTEKFDATVIVEDHLIYPMKNPDGDVVGYVRILSRGNIRHIAGVIQVVPSPRLVAARRGYWNDTNLQKYMTADKVAVAQAHEDAIVEEIELERQEANILREGYGVPLLELRSFHSRSAAGEQYKIGRPSVVEHAKTAAEFIARCVGVA